MTEVARDQFVAAVRGVDERAGRQAAEDFVTEVEEAALRISEFPFSGSPRLSTEVGIEDIRHIALRRFPYLLVYRASQVECLLVLVVHRKQDYVSLFVDERPRS